MKKIVFMFFVVFTTFSVNAQVYKMYRTQNIHNQLCLNTANGSVQQIQDDAAPRHKNTFFCSRFAQSL